jgi:predicted small metal-binding protein
MSLTLACGDVVAGCPAVVRAETEDELLDQAGRHAAEAHGLTEIDDETMAALKGAVRES